MGNQQAHIIQMSSTHQVVINDMLFSHFATYHDISNYIFLRTCQQPPLAAFQAALHRQEPRALPRPS
jgi:hypothetical protein